MFGTFHWAHTHTHSISMTIWLTGAYFDILGPKLYLNFPLNGACYSLISPDTQNNPKMKPTKFREALIYELITWYFVVIVVESVLIHEFMHTGHVPSYVRLCSSIEPNGTNIERQTCIASWTTVACDGISLVCIWTHGISRLSECLGFLPLNSTMPLLPPLLPPSSSSSRWRQWMHAECG